MELGTTNELQLFLHIAVTSSGGDGGGVGRFFLTTDCFVQILFCSVDNWSSGWEAAGSDY